MWAGTALDRNHADPHGRNAERNKRRREMQARAKIGASSGLTVKLGQTHLDTSTGSTSAAVPSRPHVLGYPVDTYVEFATLFNTHPIPSFELQRRHIRKTFSQQSPPFHLFYPAPWEPLKGHTIDVEMLDRRNWHPDPNIKGSIETVQRFRVALAIGDLMLLGASLVKSDEIPSIVIFESPGIADPELVIPDGCFYLTLDVISVWVWSEGWLDRHDQTGQAAEKKRKADMEEHSGGKKKRRQSGG